MASKPQPPETLRSGTNVSLAVADHTAWITLDRPDVANAITLDLARDLMRAMHTCEDSADLRVVVLGAAGPVFCGGGDLAAIRESDPNASAYVRELLVYLHEAIETIARIPVPVIAAVQGSAAGAGMALACSCDLVVCAASARFSMSYTKVGATPDGSSSWYLPRLVGFRRAMELALLNRELAAGEALAWGLVTEVVDNDRLLARVGELSSQLCEGAAHALGEAKRLIRCSYEHALSEQLSIESGAIRRAVSTEAAETLMDRFLSRKPNGRME